MKPEAPSALFVGPFALGTLSGADQVFFPGLVTPEGRVLDLRTALDEPALTTRGVFERWDTELSRLHELAATADAGWRSLEGLRVHAPLEPRQIFQSGANYRQHVIDLEVA
ncbi:hydrolase, partial [Streptomyces griseoruber]